MFYSREYYVAVCVYVLKEKIENEFKRKTRQNIDTTFL